MEVGAGAKPMTTRGAVLLRAPSTPHPLREGGQGRHPRGHVGGLGQTRRALTPPARAPPAAVGRGARFAPDPGRLDPGTGGTPLTSRPGRSEPRGR